MGQKVHPVGFRLGFIRDWESHWYAGRDYGKLLNEDIKVRKFLKKRLLIAGVPRVDIERAAEKIKVIIHAARPGIIIGRKGVEVDKIREELEKMTGKQVLVDIQEVKQPEKNAQLVAENIARQLEKRTSFRRAMKKAVSLAMDRGVKGIKVACKGRLGGAEMSRAEWYREGRVPLHTLRVYIDYGTAEAKTTAGIIGVKVWISKGEVLPEKKKKGEKLNALNAQKGKIS